MQPTLSGNVPASPELYKQILADFGSVEGMLATMIQMGNSLTGSGYIWLCSDGDGKTLLVEYANQNTPIPVGLNPLLNVDVWEHSYYLDYRNRRNDYLENWVRLIRWEIVNSRYKNSIYQ